MESFGWRVMELAPTMTRRPVRASLRERAACRVVTAVGCGNALRRRGTALGQDSACAADRLLTAFAPATDPRRIMRTAKMVPAPLPPINPLLTTRGKSAAMSGRMITLAAAALCAGLGVYVVNLALTRTEPGPTFVLAHGLFAASAGLSCLAFW
jgi:hypothetical protein